MSGKPTPPPDGPREVTATPYGYPYGTRGAGFAMSPAPLPNNDQYERESETDE